MELEQRLRGAERGGGPWVCRSVRVPPPCPGLDVSEPVCAMKMVIPVMLRENGCGVKVVCIFNLVQSRSEPGGPEDEARDSLDRAVSIRVSLQIHTSTGDQAEIRRLSDTVSPGCSLSDCSRNLGFLEGSE